MTKREAESVEVERDRLREALAWAVGFIRCNLPKTSTEYPSMRNAEDLVSGKHGLMNGEFQMAMIRAELAEHEAELYRRGYDLIGAADISNYLARCEAAGKVLEG